MSKLMIALLMTAGLALTGCAAQREAPMAAKATPPAPITKEAYDSAVRNAEAQYKTDKDACSSRSGNAKDICLAEANGKEKVAKANAEAAYKATPKAREDARVARAEATHSPRKNATILRAMPRTCALRKQTPRWSRPRPTRRSTG